MSFAYVEPATLDEAVVALADDDSVALAGGTAFSLLYRQGLIRPSHVVGLRRLAELRGIEAGPAGLRIGAAVTHQAVAASAVVRAAQPALAAAMASIATIRIRNQATIGGNLAHADPAQDPPPILIALGAVVDIVAPGGRHREIAVEDLFLDVLATTLEAGELITGVRVPAAAAGARSTYVKYLPRSVDDYATVSVGASLRLGADGRISEVRVALGSVAAIPIRARGVEAALIGEAPTPARLREAAELVRDAVDPIDDARGTAGYKRAMAAVWVRRALEGLVA